MGDFQKRAGRGGNNIQNLQIDQAWKITDKQKKLKKYQLVGIDFP